MGAREDLLGAAERLTGRGRTPFSPAELIEEARSAGSNYPDTTLRTFIAGPMCLNSPDNYAVQYGDLTRVGRGLYRLAGDGERGTVPIARPADVRKAVEVVAAPHEEWFWEGNVQAAVVRHLAAERWDIRRVADTASRERGVDIEAVLDGTQLLVEVKGYPSTTYASGDRAGQTRRTSAPLQARVLQPCTPRRGAPPGGPRDSPCRARVPRTRRRTSRWLAGRRRRSPRRESSSGL